MPDIFKRGAKRIVRVALDQRPSLEKEEEEEGYTTEAVDK